MTDRLICGFTKSDGSLCREFRDGRWCLLHEGFVCAGCGKYNAVRECMIQPSLGKVCGSPLCRTCSHNLDGGHGPAEPQPFARPAPTAQANTTDQLVGLRVELIAVTVQIIKEAEKTGMIAFTQPNSPDLLAAKLLTDLPTHVAFKLLAALGATP